MVTFLVCVATFAFLGLAMVASARTARLDAEERRRQRIMGEDGGYHPTRR